MFFTLGIIAILASIGLFVGGLIGGDEAPKFIKNFNWKKNGCWFLFP